MSEFCKSVETIKRGGKTNTEWNNRSLITHTIMCAIYESAMRDGVDVELKSDASGMTSYLIDGETFNDMPTKNWNQ